LNGTMLVETGHAVKTDSCDGREQVAGANVRLTGHVESVYKPGASLKEGQFHGHDAHRRTRSDPVRR
jgi:hypothetical protein